jgi:transcriptional antiterminator RfaH
LPWIVAQTAPSSERLALDHATRAGAVCYLPRFRKVHVHHGRRVLRGKMLFPGYLLATFDEGWRALARVTGVTRLLMNGEQPGLIDDASIAALRALHDGDGFVLLPSRPDTARFRDGQKVRVCNGAFESLEGIYVGMNAHARCQVLLSLFGAKRSVSIPEEDLVAA